MNVLIYVLLGGNPKKRKYFYWNFKKHEILLLKEQQAGRVLYATCKAPLARIQQGKEACDCCKQ
jgi:hypothetical protein